MFKRGFYGVLHRVSKRHIYRYLAEFAAYWNIFKMDDDKRLDELLESTTGLWPVYKRLTA